MAYWVPCYKIGKACKDVSGTCMGISLGVSPITFVASAFPIVGSITIALDLLNLSFVKYVLAWSVELRFFLQIKVYQVPKGNPYQSATSEETAIYRANSMILRKVYVPMGVKTDDPVSEVFNGQEVEVWSHVVWNTKWAVTFSDVKKKVDANNNFVSQKSTLVIKGRDIFIDDLLLDGILVIGSVDDAEVKAGGVIQNKGWTVESVDKDNTTLMKEVRTRGFKIV
ncbi:hypothetical protein L2E82_51390 [Cichorium intybus]|nr:hypothetical protein L2E82_51390 [Cichorium intybus]